MKFTHVCALKQLNNSLPNEIAEPSPDMNMKVAAFTVTELLYNTVAYGGYPYL